MKHTNIKSEMTDMGGNNSHVANHLHPSRLLRRLCPVQTGTTPPNR